MSFALIPCLLCHCHVRVGERACPHCGAAFLSTAVAQAPLLDSPRARRVALAAAIAGMAAGCGGEVVGQDGTTVSMASQADIAGNCASGGDCLKFTQPGGCLCGPAGQCNSASNSPPACVALDCGSGYIVSSTGQCVAIHWYEGKVPTSGGCYGSPPARV
jgi:hypothetical protein